MLRRIRPGYQLLDRSGLLVAGSGELVDDQHAAALACPNMDTISVAEPVVPVVPVVTKPPAATRSLGSGAKRIEPDNSDPGDEARAAKR